MQLTQFTDYSIRTLMYLAAHSERLCTVREIAEFYDISQNHLVKVMHKLSSLDYVTSVKGKGGGCCLHVRADEINLGQLIGELEANMVLVECFNEKTNKCRITGSCKLKGILWESQQAFLNNLKKYKLSDIVGDGVKYDFLKEPN